MVVKVMKKDNAIIRAEDGMILELELQGYVEVPANKSESDDVAKQPVPFDKAETKKMKENVEDNKPNIVTDEDAQTAEEKEEAEARAKENASAAKEDKKTK